MKTAQEIAMQAMLGDGWNRFSDGHVESPTGYFGVVEVDGSEQFQQYSTGDYDADAWLYSAIPGHYEATIDSQGFVYVYGPYSLTTATEWYNSRQRLYAEWDDEDNI